MKLMLKGEVQMSTSVFGALTGTPCDSIVLDETDVRRVAEYAHSHPDRLSTWFQTTLLTRFVRS